MISQLMYQTCSTSILAEGDKSLRLRLEFEVRTQQKNAEWTANTLHYREKEIHEGFRENGIHTVTTNQPGAGSGSSRAVVWRGGARASRFADWNRAFDFDRALLQ